MLYSKQCPSPAPTEYCLAVKMHHMLKKPSILMHSSKLLYPVYGLIKGGDDVFSIYDQKGILMNITVESMHTISVMQHN